MSAPIERDAEAGWLMGAGMVVTGVVGSGKELLELALTEEGG